MSDGHHFISFIYSFLSSSWWISKQQNSHMKRFYWCSVKNWRTEMDFQAVSWSPNMMAPHLFLWWLHEWHMTSWFTDRESWNDCEQTTVSVKFVGFCQWTYWQCAIHTASKERGGDYHTMASCQGVTTVVFDHCEVTDCNPHSHEWEKGTVR